MRKRSVLGLVCVLASYVSAAGSPQNNAAAVYGVGSKSCGLWLEAREGEKNNPTDIRHLQFESWMDGYLSAFNVWSTSATADRDIYRTDVAGAKAFLDKYCHDNPTDFFTIAVASLIGDQRSRPPR